MLALDDVVSIDPAQRSMLEFIDIVKVDIKDMDETSLRNISAELKQYPVKLLAEKVDNRDQARLCRDLGYDLFQGYYFARPTIITGKRLSHSELSLLRLLGMLLDDTDTPKLEGRVQTGTGFDRESDPLDQLRFRRCARRAFNPCAMPSPFSAAAS